MAPRDLDLRVWPAGLRRASHGWSGSRSLDRLGQRSDTLAEQAAGGACTAVSRDLQYVREIARESLDWNKLGPIVAAHRELIHNDVQRDTRKLSTFDAF